MVVADLEPARQMLGGVVIRLASLAWACRILAHPLPFPFAVLLLSPLPRLPPFGKEGAGLVAMGGKVLHIRERVVT